MTEQLARRVEAAGAAHAAVIPVSELVFDAGLRVYCEANQCGAYDSNYACPPCVGTAEEVIARAKGYENALIFQTISPLEDSYDFEGMQAAGEKHNELSERVFAGMRAEKPGCLVLSAGGCAICPRCARKDDKPCRFPEKAVSSLEAYCMNVSRIAAKCGMKYINGQNTVTYFSAVLF